MFAQGGLGIESCAGLVDEPGDREVDLNHAALEFPIGFGGKITPDGEGGCDAPKKGWKNLVQVLLNDVLARFQRIDLSPECQSGDGVYGKPHQIRLQVDGALRIRCNFPAPG